MHLEQVINPKGQAISTTEQILNHIQFSNYISFDCSTIVNSNTHVEFVYIIL